jgi:hypothetical protein
VLRLRISGAITLLLLYHVCLYEWTGKVSLFKIIIRSCNNVYFYKLKTFLQQMAISKVNKKKNMWNCVLLWTCIYLPTEKYGVTSQTTAILTVGREHILKTSVKTIFLFVFFITSLHSFHAQITSSNPIGKIFPNFISVLFSNCKIYLARRLPIQKTIFLLQFVI